MARLTTNQIKSHLLCQAARPRGAHQVPNPHGVHGVPVNEPGVLPAMVDVIATYRRAGQLSRESKPTPASERSGLRGDSSAAITPPSIAAARII